jgi:hypothetical protein
LSIRYNSREESEEKRVGKIDLSLPEMVSSPGVMSSSGKSGRCRWVYAVGESKIGASSSIVSSEVSSSIAPVQVFLKWLVYLQREHLKEMPR